MPHLSGVATAWVDVRSKQYSGVVTTCGAGGAIWHLNCTYAYGFSCFPQ